METNVDEIADGIYRLSTWVPEVAPPAGFTFNQFLIAADEPLLFHTGPRAMFPLVSEAVSRIVPVDQLRWITFGHVESDECGSMNEFLAAAPRAEVAHGGLGCMVSLNDMADRPPRPLADGEVIDLGGKRVRHIDTPHVPHAWEARVLYEETTGTLLCGDLFTHLGQHRGAHDGRHRRAGHGRRGDVPLDLAGAGHPHGDVTARRTAADDPRADARRVRTTATAAKHCSTWPTPTTSATSPESEPSLEASVEDDVEARRGAEGHAGDVRRVGVGVEAEVGQAVEDAVDGHLRLHAGRGACRGTCAARTRTRHARWTGG